jgi:WD40 repeat protein
VIAQYVLKHSPGHSALECLDEEQTFRDSILVLSLAVHRHTGKILSTLSTGQAAILEPRISKETVTVWDAHELEAWCGAWKTAEIILTGGDDAKLRLWDLREDSYSPSIVSKWYHSNRLELSHSLQS